MKKTLNLQGNWQFALDAEKTGIERALYAEALTDTISLPGTTSLAQKGPYSDQKEIGCLTDPYLFEGYAWYSREITLSEEDLAGSVFLYLERTRLTKIWVDNTPAGECNSLNTPHEYDLTPFLTGKTFRLTILVSNVDYPTKGGHLTSPDTQTNWNGILGEIALHLYDPIYISRIKTFPDVDKKEVMLQLTTVNTTGQEETLPVDILAHLTDINGDTGRSALPAEFSVSFPAGEAVTTVTYSLGEDAVLWSEYSPMIYRLSAAVNHSSEKTETTFGLRRFSTTDTEFLINGRPTFLRGKHDGLIFPLTGAVPADVGEWIRIMRISRSYGINHYRFHTCCPPDAAFTAADLLGIYMEPQLPFWGTMTAPGDEGHNEEEQQYLIEEGYRMMEAFGNHASYCMMSLGNELWGSKERISEILAGYKAVDTRHLYTQGSNNFQHTPVILPEEDFFVGVRFSKNRLFRGSYGMCDAPLGHVQTEEPSTRKNYDDVIFPQADDDAGKNGDEEIEIQYGTGVKKVKAAETSEMLIPHIPVVSHEIGQYCVYPNFREIEKYTGVLKPRNLEAFRERLKEKGMADLAEDLFYNSGKLSVLCYKEELEAAARTELLAGFQILDIQDFTGQGTALVGILDAFMDSKGLVTPEEWAGYCSDAILLAQFDSYVLTAGDTFSADLAIRYYRPDSLSEKSLQYSMVTEDGVTIATGELPFGEDIVGLKQLGNISFPLPSVTKPISCHLVLTIEGMSVKNEYELFLYPAETDYIDLTKTVSVGEGSHITYLTTEFAQAESLLAQGKRVLYLPTETADSLEGFYCTDFWCYPMFRDICNWMKKPVAVGTMGLLIRNQHPALASFPSHTYATPQWYQIVSHSDCVILDETTDKEYRPIVQMMDNFERNHKLGILFEGRVGEGRLMVCTSRLHEIADRIEAKQFTKSLLKYVTSDDFQPEQTLDMAKLRKTFIGA